MKCPNCGNQDFNETELFDFLECDLGMGGYPKKLFQAYSCTCCGRVELYVLDSEEVIKRKIAKEKAAEEKKRKEEEERKKAQEERNKRIEELMSILSNENSTLKQAREAEAELKRFGVRYGIGDCRR